ncbi:Uncharacterised protein [Vibrio cholerae]|nr:Uncharacterised protein [Vibrio cholerae]
MQQRLKCCDLCCGQRRFCFNIISRTALKALDAMQATVVCNIGGF